MNSYFQVLSLIATVVLIYWEFLTDFCTHTNTHCVSRWRVAAAALISQILSGSLDFAYFCDFSMKIFYMKLSRFVWSKYLLQATWKTRCQHEECRCIRRCNRITMEIHLYSVELLQHFRD